MTYKCEFVKPPSQPTLSVRTRASVEVLPQVLGEVYESIVQYLGELGEQPAGPPFAGYFNMDMQNLDVEIGFPVLKKLPSKGEIQSGEIGGGKVATCIYTGPYNEMASAYEELTKFIQDNGQEASGVTYEMYLNDPTETSPQELQTQIFFPLKST
jgi:effector-binding domain-containing protein